MVVVCSCGCVVVCVVGVVVCVRVPSDRVSVQGCECCVCVQYEQKSHVVGRCSSQQNRTHIACRSRGKSLFDHLQSEWCVCYWVETQEGCVPLSVCGAVCMSVYVCMCV